MKTFYCSYPVKNTQNIEIPTFIATVIPLYIAYVIFVFKFYEICTHFKYNKDKITDTYL